MRPASKRSLPQPPEHLSPEARKLWARVIACKPADWFDDGNLPILAGYCDATAERDKMVLRRTELEAVKPAGLMRTGVPLALGSASLFGASTPLARMLSGSIDPWLLAGIQGRGGQIPAPSTGKPARAFFSRDCASATGGASGAGPPSRAHEPASISPKGSAASSAGTVAGSTGVPAVGTATPCAVAGQCNRSRHRAGFCRAQGEARRVPPPTRRRQNN